mmetsp:Transcript_11113/g.25167  ORF Transcript_11113/g.25167 Transcript_11113/m.25167 type:complete len:1317 (+) Transcript_11113:100-4050(+)
MKSMKVDAIKTILGFVNASDRLALLGAAVVGVFGAALHPFMIMILSEFLQAAGDKQEMGHYIELSFLSVGLGLLVGACGAVKSAFLVLFSRQTATKLGVLYFQATIRQDITWFDKNNAVTLPHTLATDLEDIINALGSPLTQIFADAGLILTALVVSFLFAWPITIMLSAALPIYWLLLKQVEKTSMAGIGGLFWAVVESMGAAEECFSAVSTVVALGGEAREIERYSKTLVKIKDVVRRSSSKSAWWGALLNVVGSFVIYIGFLTGAVCITEEVTSIATGEVITSREIIIPILCTLLAISPLPGLAPALQTIAHCQKSADKLLELHKIGCWRVETAAGLMDVGQFDMLELKAVEFAYPVAPQQQILHGVDIALKRGSKVAVVGESGSGKSTVMNLVARFYDPTGGELLINGHACTAVNSQAFRAIVGLVPQQPVLFTVTIRANIAMGAKGKATASDVKKMCDLVKVSEFANKLPDGLETICSASHSNLSGGQKQRVALARAFLVKPQVLLLDEATSALDNKSETEILDAIKEYKRSHHSALSMLSIAHRLSTIWDSEIIYVMDAGEVIESGTHTSLCHEGGIYAEMVDIQRINGLPANAVSSQKTVGSKTGTLKDVSASMAMNRKKSLGKLMSHTVSRSLKPTRSYAVVKHQTSVRSVPLAEASAVISVFNAEDQAKVMKQKKENEEKNLQQLSLSVKYVMSYGKPGLRKAFWKVNFIYVIQSTLFPMNGGIAMPLVLVAFFFYPKEELLREIAIRGAIFIVFGAMMVTCSVAGSRCNLTVEHLCHGGLKEALFKHILRQPLSFHDDPEHMPSVLVDLLTRRCRNVASIVKNRSAIVYKVTLLMWCSLMMFAMDWVLTLVAFIVLPFMLWCMKISARSTHKAIRYGALSGQPFQIISDSLKNPKVVHAARLEEPLVRLFQLSAVETRRVCKAVRIGLSAGLSAGFFWGMAIFFFLVGILIEQELIELWAIQGFFMVLIFTSMGFNATDSSVGDIEEGKKVGYLIMELLHTVPSINGLEPNGATLEDVHPGEVRFKAVTFFYQSAPQVKVLRKMSFHVPAGTKVGVAGPSGGGKSTMFSLLHRYADPVVGDILIGEQGFPLRLLNVRWWRSQIAIVGQEPVLFKGTVLENVLYGMKTMPDQEYIDKCKEKACMDFLDKDFGQQRSTSQQNLQQTPRSNGQQPTPRGRKNSLCSEMLDEERRLGWQTELGVRGEGLSGGQKQRVALCRAFARKAPVMLLDEATSALDVATEQQVLSGIRELTEGCTSFSIAHRLSTIVGSDIIMIIHRGHVAEKGSHTELAARTGGVYAELVKGLGR